MSEIEPKKMVSRNIAVALGIICIVLVALISYFTVTGISAQNSYTNLQNQNKQLQTWLNGNETLLNQTQTDNTNLQGQVAALNTTINSLNSSLTDLQNIANLQESTVIYNGTGGSGTWFLGSNTFVIVEENILLGSFDLPPVQTDYAGYIEVIIKNSTSNSTYVQLSYSSNAFYYNRTVIVGLSGSTIFPILPTTSLSILVGNNDTKINITDSNVTYYY